MTIILTHAVTLGACVTRGCASIRIIRVWMSAAGGSGRDVALSSGSNEDWSGRAERLLQQQLKSVQEECR